MGTKASSASLVAASLAVLAIAAPLTSHADEATFRAENLMKVDYRHHDRHRNHDYDHRHRHHRPRHHKHRRHYDGGHRPYDSRSYYRRDYSPRHRSHYSGHDRSPWDFVIRYHFGD